MEPVSTRRHFISTLGSATFTGIAAIAFGITGCGGGGNRTINLETQARDFDRAYARWKALGAVSYAYTYAFAASTQSTPIINPGLGLTELQRDPELGKLVQPYPIQVGPISGLHAFSQPTIDDLFASLGAIIKQDDSVYRLESVKYDEQYGFPSDVKIANESLGTDTGHYTITDFALLA